MFRPARQMKFSFAEPPHEVSRLGNGRGGAPLSKKGFDGSLTDWCCELVRGLGLADLEQRIEVEWNPRMRSCAGRAFWPVGLIQLNPKLNEISASEVRRTVLHELAHLVAYERNPHRSIKSHGPEWQRACADLGIPDEQATHELALPTRSLKRRWKYQCPQCDYAFERVRRFKGAVACYDCCLKTTGGVFDPTYRLVEVSLST
ncbi:SprT-like domain-containing protein [Akkermansiaceae bacterium]|jgi:predicted SprT family Zn-dependent metalloprotease|nr:SprT-like domain-containing protein [Akkermansiaceae bacterium]MDB4393456.1 SprT-like domain-containing protein [bacterium]MDA7930390.1 SprT-like domain-containing protein [Akkermansiaceae bacterium]MDB4422606.1 SprT-like domain-containing protein [bacterium]MDB4484230.1 SprT-like domain-containing protein [bacterium]